MAQMPTSISPLDNLNLDVEASEVQENMEVEAMKVDMEVEDRLLFPPKSDFSKVCSCIECAAKMKVLKEFEKDLQSKADLVYQRNLQVISDQANLVDLSAAFEWTIETLDVLYTNLKRLYTKLGFSCELRRSESEEDMNHMFDRYLRIINMLMDNKLLRKSDVPYASRAGKCGDEDADILPLAGHIDAGFMHPKFTKFKDDMHSILKKIEEIEEKHKQDKTTAEEEEERPLHFSTSKNHILNQIKVLKQFPVGEIHRECQKLVQRLKPELVDLILKAYEEIEETYCRMIVIRRQFWKQYEMTVSFPRNKDEEKHSWSRLKETLDSLCQQVNSFNEWWKENEQHFTPCEGSNPKKTKTTCLAILLS
ncbi:unnamed protein product [Cuscuta epithymum]|uniref:Uncharacterized protein n=1 Tax=Cuscuta epithymum TaxID=186058 RepID=A0AAV0FKJ4_9ASTE|nr:unnamed protein product [Cuscuta epithymum]